MSKDSEKREIGVFCMDEDYELFKWKIPNVSSIPHRVDYVLQSPSFSYGGASWVLKMYPHGQTKYETAGYIDVIIERLHSEVKHSTVQHFIRCRMQCENAFKKEIMPICGNYRFDWEWPQAKIMRFMQNLKECPEKWQIAPNDTFTLVFGFYLIYKTELDKIVPVVGKRYTVSGINESQGIGELIKDHSILRNFVWKICIDKHTDENGRIGTFPFPEDYQVQSKPFNLDRASWIFKLYPYFRMKRSGKPSCDVVLKRLNSEISEHHVMLKMSIDEWKPTLISAKGSFFFNSCDTHGDVISFQLEEGNLRRHSCLHFVTDIFIKKGVEVESNPMEIVKPAVDLPEQKFKQEPESSATTYRGFNSTSKDPTTFSSVKALIDFKELFLKEEQCDVVIKVKGQEFTAHRAILIARSLVFASTFRNDMKEKATGVVEIEDCDPSSFSDFLCFLYCGNVDNLTTENVFSLFATADKYDVQDLRSQCMEFIKNNLSITSFCNTVTLALQYSEDELLQLSIDFLAKNLQDVIMTVEWQKLLIESPIQCNELMIKALKSNKN